MLRLMKCADQKNRLEMLSAFHYEIGLTSELSVSELMKVIFHPGRTFTHTSMHTTTWHMTSSMVSLQQELLLLVRSTIQHQELQPWGWGGVEGHKIIELIWICLHCHFYISCLKWVETQVGWLNRYGAGMPAENGRLFYQSETFFIVIFFVSGQSG